MTNEEMFELCRKLTDLFKKYGLCFGSGEYTEVKPEKTGGTYGQKNNRLSGEDSDG